MNWENIKKAVELIQTGVTNKLVQENVTVYLVPGAKTNVIRIDIKETK